MSELAARISALSPEKQRLLELLAKRQGKAAAPPALTEPFSLVQPADREKLPPEVEDAYPLTMVQLGMLYHMEMTPDAPTPAYHNVNSFGLRLPLDVPLLEEAVQRVVRRHPVLRTAFALTGYSEPLQLVYRSAFLHLEVEDLRHLPREERMAVIGRFIEEENRRLVDLSQPPLIRFHIHRREDDGFQFTLTEPHAISDGWSTMLTLSEILDWYMAALRGEPRPAAPPLAAAYRDFVHLERQALQSAATRSFWAAELAALPAERLPRLPGLRLSPAQERDHKPTFEIGRSVVERLERLARLAGVPSKTVLLTAHLKVMSLLMGSPDVVTGLTTHGRPEGPDGEQVRGLFLNTLPLHLELPAGASWEELVRRVFAAELALLPHRRFPLAALQRLRGGQALFEVIFTYLHFHSVRGVLRGGLGMTTGHSDLSVTHFPLAATFVRDPVDDLSITLTLERNDPGLSAAQVWAMQGSFRRVLEAMAADPAAAHGDCALLSPAERHQVVAEWNDTAVRFAADALLHEAFEARAAAAPEAVAVVGEDGRLTYGEVEARANRLARLLADRGVGPGAMVGIYLERSVMMVPALLAVLKAGGAYVPLSDSFPPARMEWILASLGVRHLLTQTPRLPVAQQLQAAVPALAHLVCVDDDGAAGLPATPLPRRADAGDLAYVIFTSGSTGRPKGVVVRHRPVVNLLEWALRTFAFGPEDRVLFVTSLSFDLSVFDVFGLLAAGGSIHVASRRDLDEPERLVHLLAAEPITFWDSAPAALQQLVPLFPREPATASRLRLVFFSGDWIPLGLPGRVRTAFPGARVVSLGGATEATVWSNVFPVGELAPHWVSIPYGRPIQNARYHILDSAFMPCPVGVPGDLYIGGDCLSAGYAAAPDLTADRYLPDPFGPAFPPAAGAEAGGRLYRTGDRARFFADGTMEFLGRLDHQVKLRGFRIELGEIEAVLGQHPAVREAVVLVREDVPGQRRLVAYVTPRQETAPAAEELHRLCQARLPDYMVPAAFVVLDLFPVTANGKLDRAALPAPEADGGAAGHAQVAPRTALERAVAEAWAGVLGREAVAVHDSFFALGGDSLLAIQLIMRLRESLGVELPLRGLFEHPTVAELALAVARARAAGGTGSLPAVTPAPAERHEPFPLTDLQQAYWLGQRSDFDLGGMSAHVYQERDFADLDPARLEAAWNRLVQRHPMLRAVVLPDGRQRVLADVAPYRITAMDRSEAEAAALGRRMADQGPATDAWPLFEVRLSRLDERRFRLHVSLSLLIADAVGLNVLQGELRRLYADPGTELPPLDLTFRDYVLAMAGDEGSAAFARARDYWLARLPSLPPAPELPLQNARPETGAPRFLHHGWHLEPEGWRRFRERAARAGVTPTAAVFAAYAQTLAAWSQEPRFTLNILYFNRLPIHPQVDRVVGNFSSTLPVAVDAAGSASFEERAQRLQERLWQDLEHGRFSGVRVVRELARLHGVSSRPVLPVVFTSDINLAPPEAGVTPEQVDAAHVQFALQTPQVWLDHQASELAGRLVLSWQVVEGLFPEGLVEAMFAAYCALIARLGAEEDVWTFPMTVPPPAAHLALAAEANATAAPIAPRPLHAAFAEQARRTPGSPAVVTAGRTVSYGELAGCAARLAGRLRELGAGPDRLVAVAMEKGWEQAAAVLAVLEAGAAYLPLDPGLPRERRWHLLEAGQVEIVLTQPWLESGLDGPRALQVVPVTPADLVAQGDEPAAAAAPTNLAYVIFTSGSTGLPKGVAIEHGSAWNTVADVNGRVGLGPADRVLALSALSFDLSVWDLFGPLSTGGAVVMPDAGALREPTAWVERMESQGVTVWNSVPALMEMLVDHLEGRGEPLPPALRLVLLSGDWIPVSLPDRIRRLGPHVRVVSLGGATEASIWSIVHPIDAVDPAWSSIPYGRPMANQTFQVLDDALRPRPVWVPGPLFIGGVGLARGYWRDEERTRAAFLVHPETGERLYRTGDLGRRLPDGTLELLGREDFQLKIQGYRIEPGEIEAALLAHPGVRAAVATAVGPRRGAKRLVAYVVPAAEGLDLEELRQLLAAKLPAYMVPAAFVRLDELPLTANGKVDRQALPDPDRLRPGREAVPPRDELEATLARIWSDVLGDVLGETPVSVHDDFFELGGHSLLAVRLMGRIQSELGRELPLSTLFAAPTVAALAGLLRQAPAAAGTAPVPALVKVQPGGPGLPFFCVHPVGGSVLCYRDLARELGTGQPFFALQTPDPAPASVAEMAAAYLAEVRQVQPHGPYRLGGWSMGGVVAYEMARQLAGAGEEVELLAMIDPWTPGRVEPAAVDDAVLASWFLGDLGGLMGVELAIDPAALRPLAPGARAALLLERAQAAHVLPPDLGAAELSRHLETFQRNFRALLEYVPGESPGSPLLFLAADGGAADHAAETWSRLTGGAEVHLLPGDHYSIVRPPQVEALAQVLGAALVREMALP